ncbi:MAG: ribonuclease Y, partial [bacterium]|nr:ribonuclease Y [bacterium]
KETAKEQARELVVNAIQRTAVNVVAAVTTTAIQLPNEELKGRIIGKEGRNIRAFETATGCDIIIDDSPDTVTLSCFNPIRRETGRIALTDLVSDGRINPARIEESVKNAEANLEKTIIGIGQEAAEELRLKFHPKLIELIGRLNYRTSYGQNILKHSMEAAHIAGILATELGLDVDLAKRGTLLHDIGKALDFETEGSHVDIGDTVCRKYGESEAVINCINAHHEDEAPATIEAVIVMMADAISSARPGARRESIEKYIERLTKLEAIAKTFDGVKKVFAIQAGREVRVLVEPSEVRDNRMYKLARDIAKRIESEVDYPGEVTVSLIRETRAYSTAK